MSASAEASPTRVLLVYSTTDAITEDHIQAVKTRAAVLGLELQHTSIFTAGDASEFSGANAPKPSEWIKKNESKILGRLSQRIREMSPEYLLLHTGIAFLFAPQTILSVISDLKSSYPSVVLGIQRSKTLKLTIEESAPSVASDIAKLFDQSARTQELLEVLLP